MRKAKILTDIAIKQSQRWPNETIHISEIGAGISKVLNKLPERLSTVLRPFVNTSLILKGQKHYDVVITANIKTGQLFAVIRSFLGLKSKKHFILELMLDEESSTKKWKIKRSLQRFIFSSVDIVFVSSSREVETYSKRFNLPGDRFKFILFHTNIVNPRIINTPESYILSAGRTGRDYRTFAEAINELPNEVVIVSDLESINGISIQRNVRLLRDIPYNEYLELLEKCAFVVIPLKELVKSTGQVVILEAMASGKPVIATDTVGTRDYIKNGWNGLLVPPDDAVSMRKAIIKMTSDHSLRKRISENAMNFVNENCTFEKYIDKILAEANFIA